MRRTSLKASVTIVTWPGVRRISTGYDATAIIRGKPYGRQCTASLAGGSPRFVASASAARWASKALAYGCLSTIGVAGGGTSFGSRPRPPPSGTQEPPMSGVRDCAPTRPTAALERSRNVMARRSRVIDLLGRGWGRGRRAWPDAAGAAVAEHATIGQGDAHEQAAGFAVLEGRHQGD